MQKKTNFPNYFPVDRAVKRFDMERAEAIKLLKEIAASGGGEFKIGRRGYPTRLQFRD